MSIKVKYVSENSTITKRDGDAGFDLYINSIKRSKNKIEIGLGICVEIPKGYFGDLRARSSIHKYEMMLYNGAGVIDSNYRGEVKIILRPFNNELDDKLKIGDRVCQLLILPSPEVVFEKVNRLTDSDRGTGGFGSTGV